MNPVQAPRADTDTSHVGRNLLRFSGWGAVWGLVLGFGVLAPGTLLTHRLRPLNVGQWLLLDVALAVIFALGGALMTAPALLLLTDALAWFRVRFRDWNWATGLAAGPVLVGTYAMLAWAIGRYYLFEPSARNQARAPALIPTGIGLVIAVPLGLWLIYRATTAARTRPPVQLLLWPLLLSVCIEAGRLPLAVPLAPDPEPATPLPLIAGRTSKPQPLLFIGLDAGNWASLDPLIAAGRLPGFEQLIARGIRGDLEAAWPPYWSTVAWGGIVTGEDRESFGMYEDLSAEAPGLPLFQAPLIVTYWSYPMIGVRRMLVEAGIVRLRVPPRAALARPPFWETLTLSGRPTAVIRMPFTYPAGPQTGPVLISDWVGTDWQIMGVTTDGPGPFVSPSDEAPALLKFFEPSPDFNDQMTAEFFPAGTSGLSDEGRAAVEELRRAFTLDAQTFAAAEHTVRKHQATNLALYLGGWDTVNHAFQRFRSASGSDAPLRGVLDRYLILLDRNVQRLIAAFASPPDVVVVSDHGFRDEWHERHAMFLAAGPGVPHADRIQPLTYADVVPTLLDLQGLTKPARLAGQSVLRRPDR